MKNKKILGFIIAIIAVVAISFGGFFVTNASAHDQEHKPSCDKHWDKCHEVSPTPSKIPCWEDEVDCITPSVTPTPTPTATPEATPTPSITTNTNGGSGVSDGRSSNPGATQAPMCSNGVTTQLPANSHVIRQGTDATVDFFITEGDSANIYVRKTGETDWNTPIASARDVIPNGDKFVSYTFHNLDANQGYDFGIQQKQGCGGGQLVTAVVVDGASYTPVLFRFSYWEWSK